MSTSFTDKIQIRKGSNRTVILFGDYAFKFPTFYSHGLFLKGCLSNWRERDFYKNFKGVYVDEKDLTDYVVPSYFCSYFGICQIQKRVVPLSDINKELALKLFNDNLSDLKKVCTDLNLSNVGILNNELKILDYGD